MNWFRSTIQGAGLATLGASSCLVVMCALSITCGFFSGNLFGVPALGFFVCLGTLALQFEVVALMALTRRKELSRLWPEVIDSLYSAVLSGLSLIDALDELALNGPERLRIHFSRLSKSLDAGSAFDQAIDEFKRNIGELHADRLCETLRLASVLGSGSLAVNLRKQSEVIRHDLAVMAQVESKQGWVTGTAKIAVLAPWIVVALLATRAENARIYNTTSGAIVLLVGFVVSAFSYRLVQILGKLPRQPRIFTR